MRIPPHAALALVCMIGAPALLHAVDGAASGPRLRVVLALPNGRDFKVPVASSPKDPRLVGTVPIGKGSLVALRISPRMDRGLVAVDVVALLGQPAKVVDWSGMTCARVEDWSHQERIGTFVLGENDSLALSDLARFALPPLGLAVEKVSGQSPDRCPVGCCCATGLWCCPNPGYCVECGSAAICCHE